MLCVYLSSGRDQFKAEPKACVPVCETEKYSMCDFIHLCVCVCVFVSVTEGVCVCMCV